MTIKISLAVVGATGLVGEAVLDLLGSRAFGLERLFVLASADSVGTPLECGGRTVKVQDLASFDFNQVQVAIFCVPTDVAQQYVPKAAATGCMVIDHSSAYRLDPAVPLVIPEVNAELLDDYGVGSIIACPHAAVTQLVLALSPIAKAVGVKAVTVTCCLASSDLGRAGIEELSSQTVALLNLKEVQSQHFTQQIAFNLISLKGTAIGGLNSMELALVKETQKILNRPDIVVNPWCIQTPVFFGHSQTLTIETQGKITTEGAQQQLQAMPSILVETDPDTLPITAVTDAARQDLLYVGRLCQHPENRQGLGLWTVADNVRRGAALGSVQIAEILVKSHL